MDHSTVWFMKLNYADTTDIGKIHTCVNVHIMFT